MNQNENLSKKAYHSPKLEVHGQLTSFVQMGSVPTTIFGTTTAGQM